ncbi:hypothetical protein EIK77_001405 [Talaromyces pinophilus]|nr:hypothetical protein EIK77_001405 [Talaromyces pinophilus]
MQHLIYLAKVAADSRDASQGITSSELHYAVGEHPEQQPQSANNQPAPAAMIPIQMETIWKDCSHQADVINDILQIMMERLKVEA